MRENMTFRELMVLGSEDQPDPAVRARAIEVHRQITQLGRTPDEAMILTEPGREPDAGRIWNVRLAVVMNLRAPDANTAICQLGRALQSAGFETIDLPDYADAFEAEDGTEADDLPVRRS